MEYIKVLERSPLFNGIPRVDIKVVLECLSASVREYGKGGVILREGEANDDIGILLSGSARSVKTDVNGKLVIVTMLWPGDYIGVLLAASRGRKSPVTVEALCGLSVLFIPVSRMLERSDCPHHPALLGNLLDGLAEKALVLHDRNDCLIKPTIRAKVLTFLEREAQRAHSRSLCIAMDRGAMAEYLDVDRSALSRELAWMKRDGIIDYDKNWFKLL